MPHTFSSLIFLSKGECILTESLGPADDEHLIKKLGVKSNRFAKEWHNLMAKQTEKESDAENSYDNFFSFLHVERRTGVYVQVIENYPMEKKACRSKIVL